MTAERLFFVAGAVLGLLAVAFGALGAHALEARLVPERLATWELGARYQMYHALALIAAAWATGRWPGTASTLAGWLFILGVLVFCGTLDALALGSPRWLGALTPIGGVAFLAGWAVLGWSAFRGA